MAERVSASGGDAGPRAAAPSILAEGDAASAVRRQTVPRSPAVRPPAIVRVGLAGLSRVSATLAARAAWRLFCTPPPPRALSPELRALWARGQPVEQVPEVRGARVAATRWGAGPPVLLLHGWGGRGAQLGALVEPLSRRGLSVVAIDAPAHGASGGRTSSALHFHDALAAVAATIGPLAGVVAHSLGTVATTMAVARGLVVPRIVFVAPINDPWPYASAFAAELGLHEGARRRLRSHAERLLSFRWGDLVVATSAARLATPLLVVHDRDDPAAAFADGALIASAWPGAQLLATKGLGHNRILRDPQVAASIAAFASGAAVASGAAEP